MKRVFRIMVVVGLAIGLLELQNPNQKAKALTVYPSFASKSVRMQKGKSLTLKIKNMQAVKSQVHKVKSVKVLTEGASGVVSVKKKSSSKLIVKGRKLGFSSLNVKFTFDMGGNRYMNYYLGCEIEVIDKQEAEIEKKLSKVRKSVPSKVLNTTPYTLAGKTYTDPADIFSLRLSEYVCGTKAFHKVSRFKPDDIQIGDVVEYKDGTLAIVTKTTYDAYALYSAYYNNGKPMLDSMMVDAQDIKAVYSKQPKRRKYAILNTIKGLEKASFSQKLSKIKKKYRNGIKWGAEKRYFWVAANRKLKACGAFAALLSDSVYGKSKSVEEISNPTFDQIKVGDVLTFSYSGYSGLHSVFVTGKSKNKLTYTNGNYDGKVKWDCVCGRSEFNWIRIWRRR